ERGVGVPHIAPRSLGDIGAFSFEQTGVARGNRTVLGEATLRHPPADVEPGFKTRVQRRTIRTCLSSGDDLLNTHEPSSLRLLFPSGVAALLFRTGTSDNHAEGKDAQRKAD